MWIAVTVLIALCTVNLATFLILYTFFSPWRRTPSGPIMVLLMSGLLGVAVQSMVGRFVDYPGRMYFTLLWLVLINIALGFLVSRLIYLQRKARKNGTSRVRIQP